LGLEFVRQLVARGDHVVAACRAPDQAAELRELLGSGRGSIVRLDVTDAASVTAAAASIGRDLAAIDLLVNAAGVEDTPSSAGPLAALDGDALIAVLRVNVVGPALVTQALATLLARSSAGVVLNLTSRMGLLEQPMRPGNVGYAISKAGLNMLTAKVAVELEGTPVTVVAISPGWVRTDMGGSDAPLSPQESVAGMLQVAGRIGPTDSGALLRHDGTVLTAAPPGEHARPVTATKNGTQQ
jgi:NAD(P)-dependent dehydrogenase (short-subunit alcohol dehydrogenase family)